MRHEYTAQITWLRGDQPFVDNRYSRRHVARFDGGAELPVSASPQVLAPPMSDPAVADPEEMLVAALSSCHMLFFLGYATKRGFRVDRYVDNAVGIMERAASGKIAITAVTLRPHASFSGDRLPSHEEIEALHHAAHEACYIANSVRADVRTEPVFDTAAA
jgi:organic hydroperoxide reductase OsmC/OhrA